MTLGAAIPPAMPGNFGRINGVSGSGSPLSSASAEYEVCFKCHADTGPRQPIVSRAQQDVGTRQQFNPSAISFHPVEASGKNPLVPSLLPGWTTASRVACSSCHTSDSGRAGGGSGPSGTHGSTYVPLLSARYETRDLTVESAQAYALCYQCHDRASILTDQSFPGHRLHIVDQRTPCSACHDAHGISSAKGTPTGNAKLMNFATLIVLPDPVTGRLEYIDEGMYRSQCYVSCHGVNHSPASYPADLPVKARGTPRGSPIGQPSGPKSPGTLGNPRPLRTPSKQGPTGAPTTPAGTPATPGVPSLPGAPGRPGDR